MTEAPADRRRTRMNFPILLSFAENDTQYFRFDGVENTRCLEQFARVAFAPRRYDYYAVSVAREKGGVYRTM